MGLDSVEIVMGWEEALGLTISDAEAAAIRTPRMAIDLLAAKLGAIDGSRGVCLTLRAFHRLRQGLIAGAAVPRAAIKPAVRLGELLPRRERKARWDSVRMASRLPALPRVGWGFGIFATTATIAELTHSIVGTEAKSLKAPGEPWTRDEVRTVVRTVVTEVSGAKNFSDDADFITDIGID